MNLKELGEISDSKYDLEHECEENEYPSTEKIVHCVEYDQEEDDSWQLHTLHFADAEDVEAGEAETAGELINHVMLLIHYCPFCGFQLD